jgi:hypothetical protein
MNDDLDALLREDLLQPPADFTQRVMKNLPAQIQPLPYATADSLPHLLAQAVQRPARHSGRAPEGPAVWPRLRWLVARAGLAGGGLLGFVLGLDQLASFVFGLWLAGAAL